eukprot:scaffold148030_cov18-Tisochrysis_lutea.AAC.1
MHACTHALTYTARNTADVPGMPQLTDILLKPECLAFKPKLSLETPKSTYCLKGVLPCFHSLKC